VLFTSHDYVVRVVTFSQCVSLIESNAWDNDWIIFTKVLQNKGRKEGNSILVQYTNACKLSPNWDHHDFLFKTIKIDQNNYNLFPCFLYLKHVNSLAFDFKFYVFHLSLISWLHQLHVNCKLHVLKQLWDSFVHVIILEWIIHIQFVYHIFHLTITFLSLMIY